MARLNELLWESLNLRDGLLLIESDQPMMWQSHEKAFNVLCNKGSVILRKFESRVGKQTFIRILRESSTPKVRLINEFIAP